MKMVAILGEHGFVYAVAWFAEHLRLVLGVKKVYFEVPNCIRM